MKVWWTIGRRIAAGFSLAVLMLIANGIVSYRSTDALIEASHWVTHTNDVLKAIDQLNSSGRIGSGWNSMPSSCSALASSGEASP